MTDYILAIDQGTSSSRAIIFDHDGRQVVSSQKEIQQYYPQAGWVEHDAKEIWHSVQTVVADCFIKSGIGPGQIAAIGITNQRETSLIWDRHTGDPIHRAIVWQSRQTTRITDDWVKDGLAGLVQEKTGLVIDAYFSASKIVWLLEHVPGARASAQAGDLLFGTIDTWLLWQLTGGQVHATDVTNASRTMLFNIHDRVWDQELLERFNIPESLLARVYPNTTIYGYTSGYLFEEHQIPIAAMIGDQQAGLFGQLAFEPGMVKTTYGTGAFMMMNTGNRPVVSDHQLLTTLAYQIGDQAVYALEGSIFVAGSAVQWLRDGLELISDSKETQALAMTATGQEDAIYLVPAFTGLGAPYWDPYARGTIFGLTRDTSKADVVRSTLQAIAYQVYDILATMESDTGIAIKSLKVDGGASENTYLMQFQSDIIQGAIDLSKEKETTALGAAFLAGLAVGYWQSMDDLKQLNPVAHRFQPKISEEKRQQYLTGWHQAVAASRFFGQSRGETNYEKGLNKS